MEGNTDILKDSFGRRHSYLRISLTEKCNLRCSYCMPEDGVAISPSANLMTASEIVSISRIFVSHGITKIRLTGGEPLLRKDILTILEQLSTLPIQLSLTTNAVIVDRFITDLKRLGISDINVSLDTLDSKTFKVLTLRDLFAKTYENILLLVKNGVRVKINAVLIKGVNESSITELIEFTRAQPVSVRFIEFMPFDGNNWRRDKLVSEEAILQAAKAAFGEALIKPLPKEANFVSRNFKISGFLGDFGIISSITNPFCDRCNRIRLTADGKLKNCLFSGQEEDLLTAYRQGQPIEPIIRQALLSKKAVRAGISHLEDLDRREQHYRNRSMTAIGG